MLELLLITTALITASPPDKPFGATQTVHSFTRLDGTIACEPTTSPPPDNQDSDDKAEVSKASQ